jgi:hypothetical protein
MLTVLAGEPEAGLPHVQLFSEAMFLAATAPFMCIEQRLVDDVGCTGSRDYRVWYGVFERGGVFG